MFLIKDRIKNFLSSRPVFLTLGLVVLGFGLSFNSAKADSLLFTCPDVATPNNNGAAEATAQGVCTIPANVNGSRLVLEYALDDGGDIYINNTLVFSLPNTFGVDVGSTPISYPAPSAGSSMTIKVVAKNGYQNNGQLAYTVYGRARIQVWGTPPTQPPPPPSGPPPPPSDLTPPTISNVKIINITTTTATVVWDTDESADSQVEYCLGFIRCGTNTTLDTSFVTKHSVNLSGLTPGRAYGVWVKSRDTTGNLGSDGYFPFNTLNIPVVQPPPPPPPAPIIVNISNLQITNITRNSAVVTWNSSQLSDSRVGICYFGNFCLYFFYRDDTLTTNHSIVMTGLTGGTVYSIRARSRDASGKVGYSDITPFTTSPKLAIINPGTVSVSSTTATIAWDTNYPANGEVVACLIRYFCYGKNQISDPSLTINHAATLTGLRPNTNYYYRITSKDPGAGDSIRTDYLNFTTGP